MEMHINPGLLDSEVTTPLLLPIFESHSGGFSLSHSKLSLALALSIHNKQHKTKKAELFENNDNDVDGLSSNRPK